MAIAELHDIRKRFDSSPVVDGVSFAVEPGETLVLLGPSGSGKTTLLRMIAGLETPDAGTIALDGTVVNDPVSRVPPERRGLSMVFQNLALWPHLTAAENIAFGLRCRGVARSERRRRTAAMLELVDLPDRGDSHPHELSGGERQRVALARALVVEPRILCLDEPLSDLDPELKTGLIEKISELSRRLEITAIHVTHDQEEAMSLASRILVLHRGRIEQIATPGELYRSPASRFVASFVGFETLLEGTWTENGAVQTRIGSVPVGEHAEGTGPVTVALRPDAIRLSPDDDGPAVVTQGHFRGDRWIYRLELDGATVTGVSSAPLAPGTHARVAVEREAAVVPRSAHDPQGAA